MTCTQPCQVWLPTAVGILLCSAEPCAVQSGRWEAPYCLTPSRSLRKRTGGADAALVQVAAQLPHPPPAEVWCRF